jgi:hypothetical protein
MRAPTLSTRRSEWGRLHARRPHYDRAAPEVADDDPLAAAEALSLAFLEQVLT